MAVENGARLTKDVDGDGIPETYGIGSTSFISLSPAINQAGGSMFDSLIWPGTHDLRSRSDGTGFYVSLKKRGIGIPQVREPITRDVIRLLPCIRPPDPDTYQDRVSPTCLRR